MAEGAGRILIVEDEEKIARFIELELTHEGYAVDKAVDGRAGVEQALAASYDLILLDVMLPQLSGLEVLRRIRRVSSVPVILLTARDAVMDKVAGLDAGADDYITKPFAIEELLARIRLALRHRPATEKAAGPQGEDAHESVSAGTSAASTEPGAAYAAGRVRLDVDRHEVAVLATDGTPARVELTNREFDVLRALMARKNIVLTREQLVREACGYDYVGETNVIDVYVRHIRAKIDDRFGLELVSTVRGVGYVVREE
ncbi:MAG: response regulator transcription factor [Coriobacteriia bacterium]|nr:response regulator transcription factor [Coriobacteriia bacterium]MBS5479357.1 response regulator transcription factor [Coriobacteriia bacterium]